MINDLSDQIEGDRRARPNRRTVLGGLGAASLAGILPGRAAFADGHGSKRLVVVQLNGGLDGLALFPPVGDVDYARQRGPLGLGRANQENGPIVIDSVFGLHPAASPLLRFWRDGQMQVAPAIAGPVPTSSHARARAVLATGRADAGSSDGWLGLTSNLLSGGDGSATKTTGIVAETPLLAGAQNLVPFNPRAFPGEIPGLSVKLDILYRDDPMMEQLIGLARSEQSQMQSVLSQDDLSSGHGAPPVQSFENYARLAGRMLASDNGPRLAVLEVDGFDTHARQGALEGTLARRLGALSDGLTVLADTLGSVWQDTVVLVLSEFGRTVRPNARLGTDNGVGGVAIALGGGVNGAGFAGPWPGLSDDTLLPGSALRADSDIRAFIAAALICHLKLPINDVIGGIFPDDVDFKPFEPSFVLS